MYSKQQKEDIREIYLHIDTMAEQIGRRRIQTFRNDKGIENIPKDLENPFRARGIRNELTAPYSPHQTMELTT